MKYIYFVYISWYRLPYAAGLEVAAVVTPIVLNVALPSVIGCRCLGRLVASRCQRDGGQTMYEARAVIMPADIGPNELLSNELPFGGRNIIKYAINHIKHAAGMRTCVITLHPAMTFRYPYEGFLVAERGHDVPLERDDALDDFLVRVLGRD